MKDNQVDLFKIARYFKEILLLHREGFSFMHFSRLAFLGLVIAVTNSPLHLYAAENPAVLKHEIELLKNQLQNMENRIVIAEQSIVATATNTSTNPSIFLKNETPKMKDLAQQSNVDSAIIAGTNPTTISKNEMLKQKDSVKNKIKKATPESSNQTPSKNMKPSDPEFANTASQEANGSPNSCIPISWQGSDISALITGAASVGYSKPFGETSSFNILDLNPVFLFSYRDLLLMRSALDFALNDEGGTDVSLDILNLNLFVNDYITFELGKFDSALGSFVQNISPPWINRLPDSPIGFDGDQAAPQSQIGVQLQGGLQLNENVAMNYSFFLANGPQAFVDTTNVGIDHISTDGFINNYGIFFVGGRLGILPIPKLEIGISAASGKLALIDINDNTNVLERNRNYQVFGADAAYKPGNWDFRAEYIQQQIRSRCESIVPEGEKWKAWYVQAAYWIPNTKVEPVVRYGKYYSPFSNQDQQQLTFGLDYWFASSVVAQVAYELNNGQHGADSNTNLFLIQLVFGY